MHRVRRSSIRRLNLQGLEARDVPAPLAGLDPHAKVANRVIIKADQVPVSPLMLNAQSLGDGFYAVTLRPNVGVSRGLKNMLAQRGVSFAEPDFTVRARLVPNDSSYGTLWGMNNTGQSAGTVDADIDAPEAWDVSTGGTSKAVGIIDTGIDYLHPDLYLNIWLNQTEIPASVRANLTDIDGDGKFTFWDLNNPVNQGAGKITDLNANGRIDGGDVLKASAVGGWADGTDGGSNGRIDDLIGWDFVNNDNDPMDDNNHGTHVAGTIGAIGNNASGVVGVNWKAQMAGLKFLSASGSGSTSAAIAALNYAVAAGIKISNNSWGGGGFSQALSDAISNAQNNGHIFVAAAGNGGSDGVGDNNDSVANYPSNYSQANVLAVGSSTRTDARSGFSNYGATTVDLFAPGSSILSTTRNNTYSTFSGTSMATPHVAGAVALVWDAHPDWTYSQVIEAVKNTVDTKAAFNGISVTGGRLNVNKAIRYSFADTAGPRVTGSTFDGTATISSARLTFNEAVNVGSFTAGDVAFTGPGGAIAISNVAVVAGSGDKQFDVTFASQSAFGTYTLTVGPNVTDVAGNAMNQDSDTTNGEATQDQYSTSLTISNVKTFSSTDVNKVIADNRRTTSTLTISEDLTISDLNVKVNLNHTWDSDLKLTLLAPDGVTAVTLVNRRGGSGDNFTDTVFDDEAGTAITSGTAPFNGTFRPEGSLTAFDTKNARGTWTLLIDDLAALDTGRLNSWSITVRA